MRNCIKLHITASDKTSSHSHTIISLDTARGLAQSSFADSWFSASHKMSANEKAPISNHGPVSQYGSLGADGSSHDGEAPGSEQSLTFHQVGYEVAEHCGRRTKTILTSCSGVMRPGLNALMGPTGSGKTTLLDVLADRKGRKGPSGDVLINGSRRPKNFKCVSGYVVQDDLMMGSLSVRENLAFSAALRLPPATTRQQRRERVEKVIQELGLSSCANTKVGTEFFRGVSGGERKRTNIGMELIIQPQVLFLDEPTTGLDAHTAVSVVRLLKRLSETREKRIIILSIHQPRYSIFSLFSSLTLLSRGQVVYHGPTQQVLPYFDSLGFPCAEHENPADFILDVLTTCENRNSIQTVVAMDTGLLAEEEEEEEGERDVDMVERYRKSDMYQSTEQELGQLWQRLEEREERGHGGRTPSAGYTSNVLWQSMIVTRRSIIGLFRDPLSLYFQIIIMVIFAFLIGIVYFDLGGKTASLDSINNIITDRTGAFFFMCMSQVFSNMSAVDLFIQRKALFIHENASGYYRVSVFFLSQVVTDLIAKRILPVLLFSVITYFMLGLDLDPGKFFIFLLTLFLVSICAAAITYTFSSIAKVTTVATLLSALTFVLSMLFGGFFIALKSLPVWLRWLKYLSLFRYGLEALSINELRGQTFYAEGFNSSLPCDRPYCIDGTQALSGLGYETAAVWVWYDMVALAGISLFFLTICWIILQLIKKHR